MPGFNFLVTILKFFVSIPVRSTAFHSCLRAGEGANVALNKFYLGMAYKLFPHNLRIRTRIHYGTDLELQYQLQGHGIPSDTFPVDGDGNMRKDIQNAWFHKHQAMESPNTKLSEIERQKWDELRIEDRSDDSDATSGYSSPANPPRHDILLGRGKPIQNHPGNVCFREYLKQFSSEYDEAPRNLRRRVLGKIRQDLKGRGIRFLHERAGRWVECSAAEAEKTISQAFRNRRKQHKKEGDMS